MALAETEARAMIAALACRPAGDLAGDPDAAALIERFLRIPGYDRQFCLELIDLARDRGRPTWALRRLAILMLEHGVLALSPDDERETADLLVALGVVAADAADARETFLALRGRLTRLDRVHRHIDGVKTSDAALAAFIEASRSECKLTLARYLFTPDEIVERIVAALAISSGVRDAQGLAQPYVREEARRCWDQLPAFEAAILSKLCHRPTIYWVSPATSSRINGLIEYPQDTVVAVIKPPGSDLEFEIKRVGLRAPDPWHVVFSRNGDDVPSTHRIQGGSMGYYLRWEAASAAALAEVHRRLHGVEAPISRTVAISTIYSVPSEGRQQHVLDYFTRLNGPTGREDTRYAMRASIEAFCREMRSQSLPARTDLELAAQFLGQVAPTQSVLIGTSSFRLDRVVAYLAPGGADTYFDKLGIAPTLAERRAFADEVLEEVLGVVTPPAIPSETHDEYVARVFAEPANRARGDRAYLSAMRQTGRFWGTLFGMRAYTYGESFVARNVGLKNVWEHGDWTLKALFLDHDGTYLSGQRSRNFHPLSAIPGIRGDHMHVWGFKDVKGAAELFGVLYRVTPDAHQDGCTALREEMRRAFQATGRAIREQDHVRRFFHHEFVDRFSDWDEIVAQFLALPEDPEVRGAWFANTSQQLEEKRYPENLRREYLSALERYGNFLELYAFLY